jgi:integrase
MAHITKKRGASGAQSPYWQAIVSFNHDGKKEQLWRSTKCVDYAQAKGVSDRWTQAAWYAGRCELMNHRQRLLDEIKIITKCPATLEVSRELLNYMIKETSGQEVQAENLFTYCANWLALREAEGLSRSSLGIYENGLNEFLQSLPEKKRNGPVASITPAEIARHQDALKASGMTGSSVNLHMTSVRMVFRQVQREMGGVDPCASVKRMKQTDSDERIPFELEQVWALVKATALKATALDVEWRGMILIAYHCGLRLGDATRLKWSNIDLEKRELRFVEEKTGHRKKKGKEQTRVYIHDGLLDHLLSLPTSDDPDAPLFRGLCTIPRESRSILARHFSWLMQQAGVKQVWGSPKKGRGRQFKKLGYHSFRHTMVSELAKTGMSREVRKLIVGHASDAAHENYTHLGLDMQKPGIEAMERVS